MVLILPFAETLVPNGDASYRTPEDRAVLVYLRKWAQDPVLLAKNIVVVLVTESLSELDPKLVRASATREVEIPRPDLAERREYLEAVRPAEWFDRLSEVPPQRLAELTAGMTRAQLAQLLDGAEAAASRSSRSTACGRPRRRSSRPRAWACSSTSSRSTTSTWSPGCRRSRGVCGARRAPSRAATRRPCRWAT